MHQISSDLPIDALLEELNKVLNDLENDPYGPQRYNWDEQYLVQFIEIVKELKTLNSSKKLFDIKLKITMISKWFEGSKIVGKKLTLNYI